MSNQAPLNVKPSGLTPEVFIDDDEYERVSSYKWSPYRIKGRWYVVATIDGRITYLHRFIMGLSHGDPTQVDHINGNGLDCRKSNMRLVTNSQNAMNRTKIREQTNSRHKGVTWHSGNKRWLARITLNGKRRTLGYFADELQAALAYDKAAKELFGEYARTNFPQT